MASAALVLFASNTLPVPGSSGSQNVNHALLDYFVRRGVEAHACSFHRFTSKELSDTEAPLDACPGIVSLTGYRRVSKDLLRRTPLFRFPDLAIVAIERLHSKLSSGNPASALRRLGRAIDNLRACTYHARPGFWDRSHFKKELAAVKPTCVVVDYAWLSPLLEFQPRKQSLNIVLTHDLVHRRAESLRARNLPLDVPDWTFDEEARHLAWADILLIEREDEIPLFQAMAPGARILVTPLAVTPFDISGRSVPGRCFFVGGTAPHNRDGLRWFLEKVWPRVRASRADASLSVCGSIRFAYDSEDPILRTPGVEWRGPVDDLQAEYADAQICVVPLHSGSGFKTKLIEALAYGKAIVTTSVGAQGLTFTGSPPVLLADEAEAFAGHILAALADLVLCQELSQRASDYVKDNLTPDRLYGPVVDLINEFHASKVSCDRT